PIAYWASESELNVFVKNSKLEKFATSSNGVQTGNNDTYVRNWSEVSYKKFKTKWIPYNKGGRFRRWYGNFDFVVNWQNNGQEIKKEKNSCTRGEEFYFSEGITWSDVTSGNLSCRYLPKGFIFDASGPSAFFTDSKNTKVGVALLNTSFANYWSKILNPTLHFQSGDFRKLALSEKFINDRVISCASACIRLSEIDWNTYETSWDFTENPLIQLHAETPSQTLSETYQAWWDSNQATIAEMKRLEEENNRLFIEAYGLQDELTPEVPLEEITLTVNPKYRYGGKASDDELAQRFQADTMAELISYAVGCMFGRYSLDRKGLVYAHAGNVGFADLVNEGAYQTFPADDDGIVPLTDQEWFVDDVTNRVQEFVKTVWGEAQLYDNLAFIAESLGLYAIKPKNNESALDTIRRYLSTKFYKDHLQTYKKRPIYWLFSSGKQKAFECLVYLHRYNAGTLSRMRTEYVIKLMGKYQTFAEQLQNQIESADTTTQANKLKKELTALQKKQAELSTFDEQLKQFADEQIALDLDDGVKANYGKFGDLLVDVKSIVGKAKG
ncbi:SAM-dependent methyltransferase, partial [Hydrogenovibrio sp. SC-1]|uniref:BREX-1 system adenine-specific DNA-methyltransferase PglX n=1 Tax=Hydrogenovibrio sp. SC-1 TaxID=2065820 RepID=UPI000CB2C1E4